MRRYKDLTGYRQGYLEAIEPVLESGGSNKHMKWRCLCHRCGKYTNVESEHLTSKTRPQLSCCLKGSYESQTCEDLTGQHFGFLTVLNIAKRGAKGKHVKWNCLCYCGNTTVVDSSDLKKGNIISCGCKHMQKGEIAVRDCLVSNNINFRSEYVLYDLFTSNGGNPRMDFAIFDNKNSILGFIEYQGVQHYVNLGDFGRQAREETDEMKKRYCKRKSIPLFEIRFDDNVPEVVNKILSTLMLIPCQTSDNEEGVSTILNGVADE